MTLKYTPLDRKVSLLATVFFFFAFFCNSWKSRNGNGAALAFPAPVRTAGPSCYNHAKKLRLSNAISPTSSPSSSFRLYVQSKRRRNRVFAVGDGGGESSWIKFKKLVYNGLDGVSAIAQQDTEGNLENNVQKGRIQEGYDSSLEASMRDTADPSQQVWNTIEQYAFRVRQGPPVSTLQQERRQEEDSKKSSFDSMKAGVYSAFDFMASPSAKWTNADVQEQKNTIVTSSLAVPSKPSVNRAVTLSDVSSTSNPVQRMQAELEIREKEARARAAVRNEIIRAKKEDLYRIVDSFQASVDALPETFDRTEAAVLEVFAAAKTLPDQVEKKVQEIQAIPEKVAKKAAEAQRSIQESMEMTQQVAKDVQGIPQSVARSAEETKKSIVNTQESVQEAVTTVKVLVGLEKPKPKPPKLPPPPNKSAKEIAAGLAGEAAKATGKLAWWTGKNAATLVWKGAGVAFSKGLETLGPVVTEAWNQKVNAMPPHSTNRSPSSGEKKPAPPLIESRMENQSKQKVVPEQPPFTTGAVTSEIKQVAVAKTLSQAELDIEIEEAQALAKEVADALDMAERALLMSKIDDIKNPNR